MSDVESRCLETFPEWLRSLADDASEVAVVIDDPSCSEVARRYAAGALNYLFKSLDLIPDGIEDLGFLDDAFVLRVASALAIADAPDVREQVAAFARLADDTQLIRDVLGDDYPRLEAYVKRLTIGAARGRTVDEIIGDEAVRRDFMNEISGWSRSYEAPAFTQDEKNLVKLRSFLSAKLPPAS